MNISFRVSVLLCSLSVIIASGCSTARVAVERSYEPLSKDIRAWGGDAIIVNQPTVHSGLATTGHAADLRAALIQHLSSQSLVPVVEHSTEAERPITVHPSIAFAGWIGDADQYHDPRPTATPQHRRALYAVTIRYDGPDGQVWSDSQQLTYHLDEPWSATWLDAIEPIAWNKRKPKSASRHQHPDRTLGVLADIVAAHSARQVLPSAMSGHLRLWRIRDPHNRDGIALAREGQWEFAVAAFARAVDADVTNPERRANLFAAQTVYRPRLSSARTAHTGPTDAYRYNKSAMAIVDDDDDGASATVETE